jgi:integrase/recombinase XerD
VDCGVSLGALTCTMRERCGRARNERHSKMRAERRAAGAQHGPTLSDCIAKYLTSRAGETTDTTLRLHRLTLERLRVYTGTTYMSDLTVDMVEIFKVSGWPPEMEPASRAVYFSKVRCFLKAAYRRDWLKEDIIGRVTPLRTVHEQREPYTDTEVTKILTRALAMTGGERGYAGHPLTFRVLLDLILETGMRVGDAIMYDPARTVRGDHLWVYSFQPQKQERAKRSKTIEAYLTDGLHAAIDDCEWLSVTKPFAYGGYTALCLSKKAWDQMQDIGERTGVQDCRPHRLRDTFAVRKLLSGMSLDDVSRLLGHSSVSITEMYYAHWSSRRKARLERLVAESLVHP